jgi:hypothetical protein
MDNQTSVWMVLIAASAWRFRTVNCPDCRFRTYRAVWI